MLWIAIVVIAVILLVRMVSVSRESYEKKILGSADCAYAMNGGNTAYCNDWLSAYRNNQQCANDGYEICCDRALKCCNEIATCEGGKDCRDVRYKPTKDNAIMYDQDFSVDQ